MKIDRDRQMWEVLNVIRPSTRKHRHKGSYGFLIPLTDKRINSVFPKPSNERKPNEKTNK